MARQKDTAHAGVKAADDAAQQTAKVTQMAEKQQGTRLRRRRQQQQQQQAQKEPESRTTSTSAADEADPADCMAWYKYYPWQYGGVTLATVACCNTVAFYDQFDPWKVSKMMAWMLLALLALAVHETRPFKRMNYGDKAREQGMSMGKMFGL